jgi:hypothetical protein
MNMTFRASIFLLFTIFFITNANSQELAPNQLSPAGVFDNLFDRFGNSYSLDELQITEHLRNNKSALLCSAGYFDLYFELNSGTEGNSPTELSRRDVICQVFNDLSELIVPANPNVKVNIWIRDISVIVATPSNSNVLGLASSFYSVPGNASGYKGIADNEIWKTIHSGSDSYTNVTSPLVSLGGPNATFYHGMVAFNFSNPSINWHTNLNQTTSNGLYDMYSVALHEIIHALGFTSLIDENGDSKFGSNNAYYSRYDLFLETSSSVPLITNTGGCSMYNYEFNPSLNPNILAPATFNCATHIKFAGSVNQAVHSPVTFAPGSSLSHLEDLCAIPNTYSDDEYYVMSDGNGTGPGYMKRYLKSEERNVLCDIGYHVNTTFGNALNLNFVDYGGSACTGLQVAGTNDGIDSNGFYEHTVTIGNSITLTLSDILQNDFNASSFECLEDIYGNGTVSTTSGTSFNYTASSPGLALLRYVPVSSSGNKGNITYIFIHVKSGNCTVSACNIVNNGGFENGINCGGLNSTLNCSNPLIPEAYCWTTLTGTPDYFVRSCIESVCIGNALNFTVPSSLETPVIETWNSDNEINDKMLGIVSLNYSPTTLNEGIQVSLQTPLQPNTPYTLKFVARTLVNTLYQYWDVPGVLEFAGSNSLLAPIGYFFNSIPPSLTPLTQQTIHNVNGWNTYEVTIINTSPDPINYISIINAGYLNGNPTSTRSYIVIDDISIVESDQIGVLNLPNSICQSETIQDLSLYLSSTPPGGEFSGDGVTLNNGNYIYEPIGVSNYQITYTYTTNLGCVKTISDTISVTPAPDVNIMAFNPDTICEYNSTILLPTGTPAGGIYNGTGISGGNFDPALAQAGTHQITYSYTAGNSCTNTDTTSITIESCAGVETYNNPFGILIYPNPTSGEFTIEKPKNLNSDVIIKLVDVNSKLILKDNLPTDKQELKIDLRTFSTGIYYLQFIVEGEQFIKKIIKI